MAVTPLNAVQKNAALTIGRAQWARAFKKQFPSATKEQRMASWKQNRKEYVQIGRISVRQLARAGFQITGGTPRPKAKRGA
jgi:hypothetical protein